MQTTALPSLAELGLPSTLFYPRMPFWTIGSGVSKLSAFAHVVAQLGVLDAAEDEILASFGDAIACLVVHGSLLIDRYRHDATGAVIWSSISGTDCAQCDKGTAPFRN